MKAHTKGRIDFLDYMRVFAFLSVLIGHLFLPKVLAFSLNAENHVTLRSIADLLYSVCYGGAAGVVVFFFTSGYIITYVLQGETTKEFVIKRIFRIYPLYIFAVLIETALLHLHDGAALPSIRILIERLLLIGDLTGTPYALNGVEWTLRIEVFFYAFMAALKYAGVFKHIRILPYIFLMSATLLYIGTPFPNWAGWSDGYLNLYGPFLFVGSLIFLIEKNLANRAISTISIIAIFLMFYLHTAEIKPGLKETNHAIIALLVFLTGWAFQSKIHAGATIKLLSEMTFAIYLFHSWLIRYIRELISAITNNPITSEILSFAVLFLWCYIACKLIEKRGVILGRHFLHSRPHIPNSTLKTTIIKD